MSGRNLECEPEGHLNRAWTSLLAGLYGGDLTEGSAADRRFGVGEIFDVEKVGKLRLVAKVEPFGEGEFLTHLC